MEEPLSVCGEPVFLLFRSEGESVLSVSFPLFDRGELYHRHSDRKQEKGAEKVDGYRNYL